MPESPDVEEARRRLIALLQSSRSAGTVNDEEFQRLTKAVNSSAQKVVQGGAQVGPGRPSAHEKGNQVGYCSRCGTGLRPTAKFCDGCGQSLAVAQDLTAPLPRLRTEYTQVFLDWKANGVPYDTAKNPPHPLSQERSMAVAQQRVVKELDAMLQQGWSMDGPFDSAVKWEKTSHMHFFQTAWYGRYTGAHIKLRRLTE